MIEIIISQLSRLVIRLQLHVDQDYLTQQIKKKKKKIQLPSIYIPKYISTFEWKSLHPPVSVSRSTRFPFGRKLFRNARELAHKTG